MFRKRRKVNIEKFPCYHPDLFVAPRQEEPQASKQPFKWTPLRDVDEIRLLRLPSRTESKHSSALKATIHHVYLSDSPLYTAISWMWGHRKDFIDVEINGMTLPIQANLGRIIHHLQDKDQARNVWIDAVCIDQASVEERNHQVQLMGRIYSNASYVVACLMAEESSDREKLVDIAMMVHRSFDQRGFDLPQGWVNTYRHPCTPYCLSDYRLFFENQYFTRRWIIQEILQARSVALCCEGYQMPMSILESASDDSRRQQHYPVMSLNSYQPNFMKSRALQLCRLRRESDNDSSRTLEELLHTHEKAECSDFRDQIYALLSLSKRAKRHLPVSYDVERIDLMLSVIAFSQLHEGLTPIRMLSFTCFLRQNLKCKASEISSAILNPGPSLMNTETTLQGIIRGIVRTVRLNPETEGAATSIRRTVPALRTRRKLELRPLTTSYSHHNAISTPLVMYVQQSPKTNEANMPTTISGIDQCLFAFQGDDSRSSPKAYREPATIAGLASTRIDVGDEVWQFERTPLAVIARRSPCGYTLLGRAYLLKALSTGCHSDEAERLPQPRRKLEDDLIWVKHANLHSLRTPVIQTDFSGLLRMMTWVTHKI